LNPDGIVGRLTKQAVQAAEQADKLRKLETVATAGKVTGGVVAGAGGVGGAILSGVEAANETVAKVQPVIDNASFMGTYGWYIAGTVIAIITIGAVGFALYKWVNK